MSENGIDELFIFNQHQRMYIFNLDIADAQKKTGQCRPRMETSDWLEMMVLVVTGNVGDGYVQ